ncbi:MAG: T9SS type A sorting domain-containing protein [candidate division WOR-3 bacterium]
MAKALSYKGDRDSVIRGDFLCNDDITGGCPQSGPAIAIGSDGSFVIAWYEFRDGDADIWFQRFDSSGHPIGTNERVNTDITMGWQGDPAGAIGLDGKFLFTWEDRREIGNSDVFAQWFDADGTRIGDNFRVSDSGVAGDQSISSVSIGADGTALVAWDDRRFGLTGDIYAQFFNPDGSPQGGNFRVNDDPIGYANQYEPSVGSDDSGRFVVVWMDGRGNNAWDWNIFFQRFRFDGTRLGNNIQVTTDDSTQWSPSIGVSPSGEFVISWDDHRRGQGDIYAQIYSSSGEPIGDNFRVNNDNGDADQFGSDVAINQLGEFIIVWTDCRDGQEDIYAQRFDIQGNRIGDEFKINTDIGGASQNSPSVAATLDGGYWVAWADARAGNLDIYCQRLARDGTPIGSNFKVNDDSASAHQRTSSIGMERQGNIGIAWDDERNGESDIYFAVFDSLGKEVGDNIKVNEELPGALHYYPSVAGGKGRFLVTWTEIRGDEADIYGQFFDREGEPSGGNFRVNSDASGGFQWYSYCALDSFNRAVVVWTDYREGKAQIFARLYDESGNPQGPEFLVSDPAAEGCYASVAMNSSGEWVVSWMDLRDGDYNIYCQLFRPDGSRIGGNIRVNTDASAVYQGYPACAISDERRIAIAWEDTRNETYNVYLQWLDSIGKPLGENERINEPLGFDYDAYSPTCSFDPSGRLVVMFNDEREGYGNPQIYCQRFREDGTRVSNNKKINEPNIFPKNVHWTVGQSVAANRERIAFTWTDNRRHRGWDIYAKLTDWNLIGVEEVKSQKPKAKSQMCATILSRKGSIKVAAQAGAYIGIYDVSGREVKRYQLRVAEEEVALDGLIPGVYFLTVRYKSMITGKKLIIE